MLWSAAIVFLLFVGSIGIAYSQTEERDNRYIASNAGFEMQFPSGWSSQVTNAEYTIVTPSNASDAMMTVLIADRLDTRKLITSGVGVDSNTVMIMEDEACKSIVDEIIVLNGNKVFHTLRECSGEQYSKIDTYVIFTLTKSIAVSLSATSEEAFDRHHEEFQSSLETISIDEPVDFRTALEIILGTTNIYTQRLQIESANSNISLTAATSSQISRMTFDEESRRLLVNLDEQRRSEGHLLIPAHRLLLGPYQVYVDGEATDEFIVIGDESGVTQLINVRYGKGAHEVEIIGAQVVPEFGPGAVGILAATTAAVLLLKRKMV